MSVASDRPAPPARRRLIVLVPLLVFLALAALFLFRLGSGDPARLPSALIGRPVPDTPLPPVAGLVRDGVPVPGVAGADFKDAVTLVNVWASWCVPCRTEHPLLMELAKREDIRVVGINYKDDPDNARRFLMTLGMPFAAVGGDPNGRTAVDWGVYGVPESFLVDGEGVIRMKWIGPLSTAALKDEIIPKIEGLRRGGGS